MEYSSINNFRDYQGSAQKFGRFLFQCLCMRERFDSDHFSGPWRWHLDYKLEKVRKCSDSSTALGNWPCGFTCQKMAGILSMHMLILTVSIDFLTRLPLPNEIKRICHFSLIIRLFDMEWIGRQETELCSAILSLFVLAPNSLIGLEPLFEPVTWWLCDIATPLLPFTWLFCIQRQMDWMQCIVYRDGHSSSEQNWFFACFAAWSHIQGSKSSFDR